MFLKQFNITLNDKKCEIELESFCKKNEVLNLIKNLHYIFKKLN